MIFYGRMVENSDSYLYEFTKSQRMYMLPSHVRKLMFVVHNVQKSYNINVRKYSVAC